MAVSQVTGTGSTFGANALTLYPNGPLTAEEKEELTYLLQTQMGLNPQLAETMVSSLSPQQARHMIANNGQITKDDAISLYGLSKAEADMLFGDQEVIGLFSKSFGDVYLFFLTLAAEMEADLSVLFQDVVMKEFNLKNKSNDQSLAGAVGKFIFGMTAAVITVGGAAIHAKGTLGNSKGAWTNLTSPMFLQLFTAIPNSMGEFFQQLHEHAAKKYQNYAELFDKSSGIVREEGSQVNSSENTITQGLSSM